MRDRMRMAMRAGGLGAAVVVALVTAGPANADDACAPPYFEGSRVYGVFGTLLANDVVDLDGDGVLDVVGVGDADGGAPSRIWTFLGDGAGGFTLSAESRADSRLRDLAVHDFTGDGVLDVAASNSTTDTVDLFAGVGDGTFVPHSSHPVGEEPILLLAADLNGDGARDVVVLNDDSASVSVLLADGAGGFGAAIETATTASPYDFQLADLNHDGVVDVLVSSPFAEELAVHIGVGDGSYLAMAVYSTPGHASQIEVNDVNGDGWVDVGLRNQQTSGETIDIFLGSSDGTLESGKGIDVGAKMRDFVFHDLDEDGVCECCLSVDPSAIVVLSADSNGVFTVEQTLETDDWFYTLDFHDLDGEGLDDIVGSSAYNGFSTLLSGDASHYPIGRTLDLGLSDGGNVVGDVNHDGIADVITRGSGPGQVWLGHRDGTYTMRGELDLVGGVTRFALADLDGDGNPDLVASAFTTGVETRLGNGDGTFGERRIFPSGLVPLELDVADINQDGMLDVVTLTASDDQVRVFYGFGDGSLSVPLAVGSLGDNPRGLAIGDVDGDQRPDVLVRDQDKSSVLLLRGGVNGGLEAPVVFTDQDGLRSIAAADVNHDGLTDVLCGTDTNLVVMYLADGIGGFTLNVRRGWRPVDFIRVADVTGDGLRDLVAGGGGAIHIWCGEPEGPGEELVATGIPYGSLDSEFFIVDVDADQRIDAVSIHEGQLKIKSALCAASGECAADVDASGTVDFNDLLVVLGAWGTDGADVTDDGLTDLADVIAVLAAWGAC